MKNRKKIYFEQLNEMEKFYGTHIKDCFQMGGSAMKEVLIFLKAK